MSFHQQFLLLKQQWLKTYWLAILTLAITTSSTSTAFCQDIDSNKIVSSDDENGRNKIDDFKLYWNVPTFQCRSNNILFSELAEKYGITQNANDDFRGENIAILYDPGAFPAILKSETTNKEVLRNGGVPQEGSLSFHLNLYQEKVEELIPNTNFSGLAVIDFESWRPIFRQNFGSLVPYKELSFKIERQRHPLWPETLIVKEATQRFESRARPYVEETLKLSKKLRPLAKWGYYAYPYCFNMSPNNLYTDCSKEVQKENDRLPWMFKNSDMLNPSLYLPEERLNPSQRIQLIEGRINEAQRINKRLDINLPIYPYFWYKYQDTKNFLSKGDLIAAFSKLKKLNVNGIIMWGSSNDVNSKSKCKEMYDYVDNILGPIWMQFSSTNLK